MSAEHALFQPPPARDIAAPAADDLARYRNRLSRIAAAAQAASRAAGPDVPGQLVRALAELAGADAALIAVPAPALPGAMHTPAVWLDGAPLAAVEFDLERSPCAHLAGRDTRVVARGARQDFARGTLLPGAGFDASPRARCSTRRAGASA
jgi:hypothetical protein